MFTTVESRIERYSNTYSRLSVVLNALQSIQNVDLDKKIERLANCSNYLEYKHYTFTNQAKLSKANFCELYTLCPLCASIKQAKTACDYSQAIKQILTKNKKLKPYFITYTINTGTSLSERFNTFKSVLDKISNKIKHTKRSESLSEFSNLKGFLTRIEYKQSEKKRWNVHAHSIVLAEYIDFQRLNEEYKALSNSDSIEISIIQKCNIKRTLNYIFKPAFYLTNPLDFNDLPQILETVLTDIEPRTRLTRAGGLLRSIAKDIKSKEGYSHSYKLRKFRRLGGEYVSFDTLH